MVDWNSTKAAYPLEQSFPQLFEQQVESTPDAIAVVFADKQLTYQQLNSRANRWARHLVELGVGAETVVALMCDRNLDFLTAMLAIFKAGGAYLPLSPDHPAERLQKILLQGCVPLVLAGKQRESLISPIINQLEITTQSVYIEDLDQLDRSTDNLPIRCNPDNLAYVIYTSGSTGIPKGAMLEHRGMLNHLYAKVTDLNLSANDIVAQTASQTFDISVWQFLVALLVGGKVEIIPTEIATDPTQLLSLVQFHRISILEIVPSLLRMILQQIENAAMPAKLTTLRWLLLTGETLSPQLCRQWFEHYPNIPIINAYGPTECSDDVTHYPIYASPTAEILNLPIGRPIANTQLYILDHRLQPVPIGVAGELYVGGVGVGRGYLNAPELTQQAFILNPFAHSAGGCKHPGRNRLYKTGDKARYLTDGKIEFLGRIDYQVKIRGFRIELGEIEAVLNQYPQVREVTVIAREEQPGNPYLAVYIVTSQAVTTSDLRDFLKQKLPDYMVPGVFIFLDAIPLTPNGKVDRNALPIPDLNFSATNDFVLPVTPTQASLAKLWGEILNIPQVGIYHNFFELGGHSLLATQIASRLRALFGIELPLRRLFESPTVAELAESIDRIQSTVHKLQIDSSDRSDDREEIEI
jgi:amino acid adenylation domain-containing protein